MQMANQPSIINHESEQPADANGITQKIASQNTNTENHNGHWGKINQPVKKTRSIKLIKSTQHHNQNGSPTKRAN